MMRVFSELIPNAEARDFRGIINWTADGFDLKSLRQATALDKCDLSTVRLELGPGRRIPDYLTNPLSWPIVSPRLKDILQTQATTDIQVFDAPLFDSRTTTKPIDYYIVNVISSVNCLNLAESHILRDSQGAIRSIPKAILEASKIPKSVHLFRLSEFKHIVYISNELREMMINYKISGLKL